MRLSLFCLILLVVAGCREPDPPIETGAAETSDAPPDRAGLTADSTVTADSTGLILAERLPLGGTLDQMREVLPTFSVTEGEVAAGADMEELTAPYDLFGRPGTVELNFEGRRLTSYFFRLDTLACASADSLYARVQTVFGERFGEWEEEEQDEGGYRARSSFWTTDTLAASMTRGEQAGQCRLAWGFQTVTP